eukprot:8834214-Pyramimonas_sp.AAC.1
MAAARASVRLRNAARAPAPAHPRNVAARVCCLARAAMSASRTRTLRLSSARPPHARRVAATVRRTRSARNTAVARSASRRKRVSSELAAVHAFHTR